MTAKRVLGAAVLAVLAVGCGNSDPPRSGGRTASYWEHVLRQPDPDVELRRTAAAKLGPLLLLDKDAQPALLSALKDSDAGVRSAAARSLGVYSGAKGREALPALRDVQQQDPDAAVREAAAKAIERLTGGPAKAA